MKSIIIQSVYRRRQHRHPKERKKPGHGQKIIAKNVEMLLLYKTHVPSTALIVVCLVQTRVQEKKKKKKESHLLRVVIHVVHAMSFHHR